MFQEDIHIVKKMAREIAREEIELAFGDATPRRQRQPRKPRPTKNNLYPGRSGKMIVLS